MPGTEEMPHRFFIVVTSMRQVGQVQMCMGCFVICLGGGVPAPRFRPGALLRPELRKLLPRLLRPQDRFCYAEIFYAGGTVARDVSSSMLAGDLPPAVACGHAPDHASVVAWVIATARPGDTVLIMGARDPALPALARSVLAALESRKARAGTPGAPPDRPPRTH
jgi:hypothetical protein